MTQSAFTLFPFRRLSRQEAFVAQGVTLRSAETSWSGLRDDDGSVVFAIRDAEIEPDVEGFRCLLWSPLMAIAEVVLAGATRRERLEHCLLAQAWGAADGLVVGGAGSDVERGAIVTLRVTERRGEYWAIWGQLRAAPGCFASVRSLMHPGAAAMPMAA